MKSILVLIILVSLTTSSALSQQFMAGFKSTSLIDSSRIYKPDVELSDKLHYRPIDLDIWYPSNEVKEDSMYFRELFSLLELRANNYQTEVDYTGLTNELAQLYVSESGIDGDATELLNLKTSSFRGLSPANGSYPIIIYMSGLNGMGFENYKLLEELAQNGFIVLAISSIGRYPGDMTNHKEDLLEQVYDAKYGIDYLLSDTYFNTDSSRIGLLGYSWGGMGATILANQISSIKGIVSLDGSETHYFGSDENDPLIKEIHESDLFKPEEKKTPYLFLESDHNLGINATSSFRYYDLLSGEKHYLILSNSNHEDFKAIPSALKSSQSAIEIHQDVKALVVSFFQTYLLQEHSFNGTLQRFKTFGSAIDTPPSGLSRDEQIAIQGSVSDAKTNEKLPFVNIGVLNREVGTVSDPEGEFALSISQDFILDTLRASMIGYYPVELKVKDAFEDSPIMIEMEEKTEELNEVIVFAKALKNKRIGNATRSKFLSTGFGYEQLGAEMGIKVNVRKPTLVDTFKFHISYNRLTSKAIFRLNIYNVEDQKSKENVLRENILVAIEPEQTGLISVDLTSYNITLVNDALVTLEWVDFIGEKKTEEAIYFSLALIGNATYLKKASQSKFKKHSSLGVGFYLDVHR